MAQYFVELGSPSIPIT